MKRVSRIFWPLAFVLFLVAAPAGAVPGTVFWDGPTLAAGPGFGVSAATAASAGVPILPMANFPLAPTLTEDSIDQALDRTTLVTTGAPIITSLTITSTWTVLNDTQSSLQNLYLVFERPIANGSVVYDPSDVGLTLSSDWVILQGVASGNPLYYPAVSLGSLASGADVDFPLLYSLHNPPQEFNRPDFNLELGMPAWKLFFVSTPIPEPASGLLVLFGLLGISVGRRKRS